LSKKRAEAIAKGDYSSVLTNDFFYPDGRIPALPKEVTAVGVKGTLNVNSGGYSTKLWINGYDQSPRDPIADVSMGGPVIGGLKLGTNVIKIVVEKINKASGSGDRIPDYKIIVLRRTDSLQVFEYAPTNSPVSHEETFVVKKEDVVLNSTVARLPKQPELIDACHRFDPELNFKKWGTGINELLMAYSRTGGVQRTINILPHLVEGQPVRGVNVIVDTFPDVEIDSVQGEVANSIDTYMINFTAQFLPKTSCSLLNNLISKMTGKGEGLPAEATENDGNLRFTLKKEIQDANGKKTLHWSLEITDFQGYTESVAKELKDRK
jgi:hypothetical protein